MIIKKFQGKTEEEAVSKARAELGDALVIMNVKSVKPKGLFGFLKAQQKEVTVALEEENQANIINARIGEENSKQEASLRQAVAAVSEITREHFPEGEKSQTSEKSKAEIKKESDSEKKNVNKADDESDKKPESVTSSNSGNVQKENKKKDDVKASESTKAEALDEPVKEKGKKTESGQDSNIEFFKLLYSVMLENEVDEHVANQLIDELDRSMKPNMPIDYMLSNVYQKMILKFGPPQTIKPATKGPKFVFFVGPTGVGKTTTIAKIASKFRVIDKKKVALLTADTYRIAAAEQLRTYANILEVPFRVVYKPTEVKKALSDFKDYDYILVDTAGHSHHNEEQRENMNEFVGVLDYSVEKEVYLVVSATTKYSDLVSIANAYQTMTDYKLIFTKLDETTTLGNLLNLKLHTGAQMSYITCGQNVPDDIEEFNAQETVKRLLGGNHF